MLNNKQPQKTSENKEQNGERKTVIIFGSKNEMNEIENLEKTLSNVDNESDHEGENMKKVN